MRRMRFAVAAVLAATVLAGCAAEPTAPAEMELPAQNRIRWVMPLDQFITPTMGTLESYAQNLLIADCLGEAGIDWPIPAQPTDDASYIEPPRNLSFFPALTVPLAQEYGYRANYEAGTLDKPEDEAIEAKRRLNSIITSTPGFEPLFDACLKDARNEVPDERTFTMLNKISGVWVGEANRAAGRAEAVKTAASAWQSCMNDAGYFAVPNSPYPVDEPPMPTDELRAELGIPNPYGPGDGAPVNPLTPQEVTLAVDDATCRESSGWSDAYYQAMWDAEVDIVAEHADELVRFREEWDRNRVGMLEIIAKHAPAQ